MTRSRDVANIDGLLTAKGDIYAATAAATPARLGVGANDLLLTADSTQATGLKYSGAATSFTPTFTTLTIGNGTTTGVYNQIGKIVIVNISIIFGSTTSFSSNYFQGVLPINGVSTDAIIGQARFFDAGAGQFTGLVSNASTTAYGVVINNVSGTYPTLVDINATLPFTWTTGDSIILQFIYRMA